MKKNSKLKKYVINLVLAAMFTAIGMVLPFLTGQIQQIGKMLLPMHIPVFLCGLICGWKYGLSVGVILPVLRSITFGAPLLYPVAIAMSVELGTYGLVSGLIYSKMKKKNILSVYGAMIPAMLFGRVTWAVAEVFLLGLNGNAYTWSMFLTDGFVKAVPGIILQLVLIPSVMTPINISGVLKYQNEPCFEENN